MRISKQRKQIIKDCEYDSPRYIAAAAVSLLFRGIDSNSWTYLMRTFEEGSYLIREGL